MEISITAVTRHRKFSKAMFRHSAALSRLEQLALDVDTSGRSFDILQLVFLDRTEDYLKPVGCKDNDRLFQVEVAAPTEDQIDFGDERAFVTYAASKLKAALRHCGLPLDLQRQIDQNIDSFLLSRE